MAVQVMKIMKAMQSTKKEANADGKKEESKTMTVDGAQSGMKAIHSRQVLRNAMKADGKTAADSAKVLMKVNGKNDGKAMQAMQRFGKNTAKQAHNHPTQSEWYYVDCRGVQGPILEYKLDCPKVWKLD